MADNSGEVVITYIDKSLDREQQRRQSLETRVAVVISGSAAAVAALLATLTFAHDKDNTLIVGVGRFLVYAGIVGFAGAVALGLVALRPRFQQVVNDSDLNHYLEPDVFYKDADYSRRQIATTSLRQLRDLEKINSSLAGELLIGQLVQLGSFVAVVAGVLWLYR